ncbi:MAG: hypothetical protein Q4B77_06720 [Coriobacteriaceae bacterium]|nr:hypothetical protein [Coriobacteriaceae bacterium]
MNSQNTYRNNAPAAGGDPAKTGDLSAAAQVAAARAATKVAASRGGAKRAQAVAASGTVVRAAKTEAAEENVSPIMEGSGKPTRRSARGSEVRKREKQERREARKNKGAGSPVRGSNRIAGERAKALGQMAGADHVVVPRSKREAIRQSRMKYAADNRLVRWFYELTTGPKRVFFYGAVVIFVLVAAYSPLRDFYISQRTVMILTEQKAIRDTYNDSMAKEVEGLLSQEGVEDAARKEFNMVMPGEKSIDVKGLDDDGNSVTVDISKQGSSDGEEGSTEQGENSGDEANGAASEDKKGKLKGEDATDKKKTGSGSVAPEKGKEPKTSAEVDAAQKAVMENSAWYWKMLDAIFMFDGAKGMAVVSTGE